MWGEGLKSRINKTLLFQLGILLLGAPPPSARHNKKSIEDYMNPQRLFVINLLFLYKGV